MLPSALVTSVPSRAMETLSCSWNGSGRHAAMVMMPSRAMRMPAQDTLAHPRRQQPGQPRANMAEQCVGNEVGGALGGSRVENSSHQAPVGENARPEAVDGRDLAHHAQAAPHDNAGVEQPERTHRHAKTHIARGARHRLIRQPVERAHHGVGQQVEDLRIGVRRRRGTPKVLDGVGQLGPLAQRIDDPRRQRQRAPMPLPGQ